MPEYRLLISTAGTREDAQSIARALVERKLAACVNIVGPIESVYRWKGEVEAATECLLLIKTTAERTAAVREVLPQLHTYEVPELIEVAVEGGLPAYLDWIGDSVK